MRRRIGMVFQKPNPFPKTIFDNVAYGPKLNGRKRSEMADIVEHALTRAALWDEVKDKLKNSGLSLSGGQQQRLCIARALAVEPDVVLMDEPCSALDPIATARIEDLMEELKRDFTIVIVTHNMQQAARMSDRTAFFTAEVDDEGRRVGRLVEYDVTEKLFTAPVRRPHRGLHHRAVRLRLHEPPAARLHERRARTGAGRGPPGDRAPPPCSTTASGPCSTSCGRPCWCSTPTASRCSATPPPSATATARHADAVVAGALDVAASRGAPG